MEKFTLFWNGPFSQWYPSCFTIDGIEFNCCEQYMMYMKALLMGDKATAELIISTNYNPREYKTLGRKVSPFDANLWNEKCRDIVYKGNMAKFTQNDKLKEILFETVGTTLVEASPYDKIWGIGLLETDPRCHDRSKWLGTNWLGEAITKVRLELLGI